jgi:hypothetical protein
MPRQNIEPAKPAAEPQQPQPVEVPAEQREIQQSKIQPAQQPQKTQEVETTEQKVQQPVPAACGSRVEQLLEEIKLLLKIRHRDEQFSDFSAFKLFAGFLQIVVLACLFIALRYKISPTGQDGAVYTALGFAVVFQLMTITLYIMHKDK